MSLGPCQVRLIFGNSHVGLQGFMQGFRQQLLERERESHRDTEERESQRARERERERERERGRESECFKRNTGVLDTPGWVQHPFVFGCMVNSHYKKLSCVVR